MGVFKCKMCGAPLNFQEGATVAQCEYCGIRQTLPRLSDERRANLYDRANYFRRNNEFDKAMSIYEMVLAEDNTDAEAYWSLVLCRYGVEYVEDPASRMRIPTVNRTQYTSVFEDPNFQAAMHCADMQQKQIYQAEAEAINRIQQDILAISQQEEPFDVFICYKETDQSGRRTIDSVMAQDLYKELTKEGYKVFFARITLEDKLGTAYEPYIFAALNSAKVMVVVGTKPEHFQAVWVRNEWSRYLGLIRGGAQKTLIPAYRDMNPYELPEEFSHLQAQDMGKIGCMQDLLHGIEKLLGKKKAAPQVVTQVASNDVSPLLKRAMFFLEDKNWKEAGDYAEKVLDMDPECAMAYVIKMMALWQLTDRQQLRDLAEPFDNNGFYQRAIRFGDEELKQELEGYNAHIRQRNEAARKDKVYNRAVDAYREGKELARRAEFRAAAEKYDHAASLFEQIAEWKDARQQVQQHKVLIEELRKQEIYHRAEKCVKNGLGTSTDYERAYKTLLPLAGWKDVDEKLEQYRQTQEKLAAEEEKQKQAEKQQEKVTVFVLIAVGVTLLVLVVLFSWVIPHNKYRDAMALYEQGQYAEAAAIFAGINYEDSEEMLKKCNYSVAAELMEEGKYAEAAEAFGALGDYSNSAEMQAECLSYARYDELLPLRETNPGAAAIGLYQLGDFKDAKDQSLKLWDQIAVRETVSAGLWHTGGLKADGTVVAVGYNGSGKCDVSGWTDIVAISAGDYHTVGLKADGTVVAVGHTGYGQCDVSSWTDIVAISAGNEHTVGLKADGTVVAVGDNDDGQCNVSGWTDIVAISAGINHTVGLKADGTVVAVGRNYDGRCGVSGWTDIVAISAGDYHTVGLKADGTVVAVGKNDKGQCDVSGWTDIVAISAGDNHTVGLKADGTVVAVGKNDDGQCNVSDWTDIVAISAGDDHTVGLKADGTVMATKYTGNYNYGQCDVTEWTNIKVPK